MVKSNPTGAKVEVYDWRGEHVETRTTPFKTSVKRGSGYFKAAKYEFKGSLPGRPVRVVGFKSGLNGWYWGNILFGGLIGMVIVDPLTGGMWEPPDEVILNFSEAERPSSKAWLGETMLHDKREWSVALARRIPSNE